MDKDYRTDSNKDEKKDRSYDGFDRKIDAAAEEKHSVDLNAFLDMFVNVFEVGKDLKKVINPDIVYVAKFTPELLKKMEEHDLQFLKDKVTGEILPELYDYTDKHIGGKVRLEMKGIPNSQDITNLGSSISNLLEQQRYDALISEMKSIHAASKRIERGQDNDRFALVNSGRKKLIDAWNIKDDPALQKHMVLDALSSLRDGREAIEKTLMDKLDSVEYVRKNRLKRLWQCLRDSDFYYRQEHRYDDIQEYFQYYYLSMQPMAFAYTYLNQPQLIQNMIEDSRKVFEHENIYKLESIERLLVDREFKGVWYREIPQKEQKLLEVYNCKNKNELLISFRGQALLEAMGNEQEEKEKSI